jgi:hypothetical protein
MLRIFYFVLRNLENFMTIKDKSAMTTREKRGLLFIKLSGIPEPLKTINMVRVWFFYPSKDKNLNTEK